MQQNGSHPKPYWGGLNLEARPFLRCGNCHRSTDRGTWCRPKWACFPTTLIPQLQEFLGQSQKGLKLPKNGLWGDCCQATKPAQSHPCNLEDGGSLTRDSVKNHVESFSIHFLLLYLPSCLVLPLLLPRAPAQPACCGLV